jgi:hypothetical protein
MPYKRKVSPAIAKAKMRVSGIKSIDPTLDLGNGMSVAAYEAAIEAAEQRIETYNMAISNIGQLQNSVTEAERLLSDLSERMLSTIAGRYGKKSDQYEMAGGTKRTTRRRVAKKKTESELQSSATV